DADPRGHAVATAAMRTSESSMTGLVRNRRHMSSTSARAASSSSASSVKVMLLPTPTFETPWKPSAGSDRSMVAPWGSATPGRRLTSMRTSNLMGSSSHIVRPPPYTARCSNGHEAVALEPRRGRRRVEGRGQRKIRTHAPADQLPPRRRPRQNRVEAVTHPLERGDGQLRLGTGLAPPCDQRREDGAGTEQVLDRRSQRARRTSPPLS